MKNYFFIIICLLAFSQPVSRDTADCIAYIVIAIAGYLFYKHQLKFTNLLHTPLIKPILLYLLAIILVIPFSTDITTSIQTFFKEFRYIGIFLVIAIIGQIRDKIAIDGKVILVCYLAGVFVADLDALYQYLVLDMPRVIGLVRHPVVFAFLLMTAIPISLALLVTSTSRAAKGVCLVLLLSNLLTLLLTQSRGPLVSAAVAVILIFYLFRKHFYYNKKLIAGVLSILLILLIVAGPVYIDRVMTITDLSYASNSERLLIWQSSIEIIKDHPLVGIGLGQFINIYNSQYISPLSIEKWHPHAHNSYLMIFAENGVIGFLAFCYLLWSIVKFLYAALANNRELVYGYAAAGVLCTFIVASFVDNLFLAVNISRVLWLVLGLAVYQYGKEIINK